MPRRSPFPGMDPYLECHWGDVHQSFMTYARDQLQECLPKGLRARMEERVFVESDIHKQRPLYPDIRVIEHPQKGSSSPLAESSTAVAEPIVIDITPDPMTEAFIEVIDVGSGNRVVTVIEVLSPANKHAGTGKDLYLKKQEELVAGRVNLAEINLLRSGQHVLAVPLGMIPPAGRTPYMACVRRATRPGVAEVYPIRLRAPLPTIKVPLRETDRDVRLDLQALIDQCYRNGGYEDTDYRKEPDPAFDVADQVWADELLRGKGCGD